MIQLLTKGKKGYCAICGKEILPGTMYAMYTTKSGTAKITHNTCEAKK